MKELDPTILELYISLGEPHKEQIEDLVVRIGNKNAEAIKELSSVLGRKPKRPLYYVDMHLRYLPEFGSRDIMRYCGDYIDQLVRFTLEDNRYLSKWFLKPLGGNLKLLKKYIKPELHEQLMLFNKTYTSAKHDFNHEEDKCRFNYIDTIHYIFITKHLAEILLPMSERARDYNEHGNTFYSYDPKD